MWNFLRQTDVENQKVPNQTRNETKITQDGAPRGLGDPGSMAIYFPGSWGALVIIFRDLGSNLIVLEFKEPCKKVKKISP